MLVSERIFRLLKRFSCVFKTFTHLFVYSKFLYRVLSKGFLLSLVSFNSLKIFIEVQKSICTASTKRSYYILQTFMSCHQNIVSGSWKHFSVHHVVIKTSVSCLHSVCSFCLHTSEGSGWSLRSFPVKYERFGQLYFALCFSGVGQVV